MYLIPIFIFGALVGSFINVLALRYNTGETIIYGRSKCLSCNSNLRWFDLVPVLSFFFLKGRCRNCKNSISIQYPIVEIISGYLFLLLFVSFAFDYSFTRGINLSQFFLYHIIFLTLLVITIYDIRHKIIPNFFVYFFILLSILLLVLSFLSKSFLLSKLDLLNIFAPFLLFAFFAGLWLFSKGRWMGFGDAKLAFGIGAFLGLVYGISAIVLAFWLGTLWSLYLLVKSRISKSKKNKINLHSEIPFAPFLILATAIVFFTHLDIFGLNKFLNIFF